MKNFHVKNQIGYRKVQTSSQINNNKKKEKIICKSRNN